MARALEMACANRIPGNGLIFHSDRGVQYGAKSFRDRLGEVCPSVRQSMSRKGNCWDSRVRLFEDPLEGGFCFFFVDTAFFLAYLLFVDTLEVGVEEVGAGVEDGVDRLQSGEGLVSSEASVADSFTDDVAVFLFKVLTGMRCLRRAPGFVAQVPLDCLFAVVASSLRGRTG